MSTGRVADLEDVFDALVAAQETPGPTVLDHWIREYPQFERELVDFMASWTLMNTAASSTAAQEGEAEEAVKDADPLELRGMSIVQNLLHEVMRRDEKAARLDSLRAAAKAASMSLKDVARAAHIGDVVMRKLDRRLIRYASIPKQALGAVADALRCPVEAVALYLQRPPTFAAGAHYRADRPPQLAEPQDFIVAIQRDPTMTPEDRLRWTDALEAEHS